MIELMIGGEIKKQYPDLRTPEQETPCAWPRRQRAIVRTSVSSSRGRDRRRSPGSWSGKTELGRAIAGVDHFDSGDIYVREKQVRPRSPERRDPRGIATYPRSQEPGADPGPLIRDNYSYPSLYRISKSAS